MTKPLAISTGDPGGVGPEVATRALTALGSRESAVLFGDADRLRRGLGAVGLKLRTRILAEDQLPEDGQIGLVHVGDWDAEALSHGPTPAGGRAQLAALAEATTWALDGRARGLVTAPMSKAAVNLTGKPFRGHTEYLADRAGLAEDAVTMMFLGPRLRVGLATTHISIASAPAEVSGPRVLRAIRHMGEALRRLSAGAGEAPALWVCGLNPHAGEGGLFGDEEVVSIGPSVAVASQEAPFSCGHVVLRGPVGAETAFRMAADTSNDGVVAMLHDQATIASKLLDWGRAVNVTWGLPFVRTSVDHGVAYDAAAAGKADAEGMKSAVALAQQLTRREA